MNKQDASWSLVHSFEKKGQWENAIHCLIQLTERLATLAPLLAMEFDRIVAKYDRTLINISYSSNGFSRPVVIGNESAKMESVFRSKGNHQPSSSDTLLQAFRLVSEHSYDAALAYAYSNATGKEIDALNILYANKWVQSEKQWLYFVRKYLSQFDSCNISVRSGSSPIFFRLANAEKLDKITEGPLVSILMPAHNTEKTLWHACNSILQQTWQPIELIIVDDASTDKTWEICQKIAKNDCRVKLHRNAVNVGPYVTKNLALQFATGEYLTCHDADDWAFPRRIEHQVSILKRDPKKIKATSGTMLRMTEDGRFVRPIQTGPISDDGMLRRCFVSLFFEKSFFHQKLGAWDSVKIGADSELLARTELVAPQGVIHDKDCLMICLDHPTSLTRNEDTGIEEYTGMSATRLGYQSAWKKWHADYKNKQLYKIDFPLMSRRFIAPLELLIETDQIKKLIHHFEPSYKEGLVWVGNALRICKDSDLTEHFVQKFQSILIKKTWPISHPELYCIAQALAEVYWGKGDFNTALILINQSLEASPKDFIVMQTIIKWRLQIARSETNRDIICKRTLELAEALHADRLIIDSNYAHLLAESWAAIGQFDRARRYISAWLETKPQFNLTIANCSLDDEDSWLNAVNNYFKAINATPILLKSGDESLFLRLHSKVMENNKISNGPLISVIMTAYNVSEYISIAIESVLNQTWQNLELIIVDDASSDDTVSKVQSMMKIDRRIRLIKNDVNVGTYVGRNKAFDVAKGDFITIHDSDDWAHPEKLERQITPLLKSNKKIASFSHQARVFSNGLFPLKTPGKYFVHNASSIMFKKNKVKSAIGYWDSVRIGADSEFICRMELAFGKDSIITLPEGLMLCASRPISLSRDPEVGISINGFSEPRGEYRAAYRKWHESRKSNVLHMEFPLTKRHFLVPEIILP